ncbi:MAG TPA: HD domain-containing phosphohydrolase [Solimonas sp.]
MPAESTKATLLLAQPDASGMDALRTALQDRYTLLFASTGAAVLAFAHDDLAPELILLPATLPDMTGLQACSRLKADARTQGIPVIFVGSEAIDDEACLAAGAADCLPGPLRPALLRRRVAAQLALADQERHMGELVRKRTQDLEDSRLQLIRRLGRAAEWHINPEGETADHAGALTLLLARAAGLDEEAAANLALAALLRDVGKIGVPDSILYKTEALTLDDWELMRCHPLIGAQIIGRHPHPLMATARLVALTHHEHWDGLGYPQGLAGEAIPLEGRIVAIADTFCAIVSTRSYRPARSPAQAVALIQERAGSYYDPSLTQQLGTLLPEIEALLAKG